MAITVKDICAKTGATVLCGNTDREFSGVYVGDFLSRAMSRVEADSVWVTIMANPNVIAVATLTDPAAILLAEGVTLVDEALEAAKKNDITVISSPLSAYELCLMLGEMSEKRI